jgi:hypothetical protein
MEQQEEFRKWHRNYEISNFGRTRRKKNDGTYYYQKHKLTNGYKFISIIDEGQYRNVYIHHMVATMFIGSKQQETDEIDHVDRDRGNNHVKNLRYVSRLKNNQNTKVFIEELGTNLTGSERRRARHKYNYLKKVKEYQNRPKGTGSIRPRPKRNGEMKYEASIRMKSKTFSKTVSTEKEGEDFIKETREKNKN